MSDTVHISTTAEEFERVAAQAHMRTIIRVGAKQINNGFLHPSTWKGYVKVVEPDSDVTIDGYRHHVKGRRYTVTLSVERISAGDALKDANNHRDWCVEILQLP